MDNDIIKLDSIANEIIQLSRNKLIIEFRFMDKAISLLNCVPAPIEGIAVNGSHIFYDPFFVISVFKKGQTLMTRYYLHMILHCVYQHFWVRQEVNRRYWNLACDIAVENTINELRMDFFHTPSSDIQLQEVEILRQSVKYVTAEWLYQYFSTSNLSEEEYQRLQRLFHADTHDCWYSENNNSIMSGGISCYNSIDGSDNDNSTHPDENFDTGNEENNKNPNNNLDNFQSIQSEIQQSLSSWEEIAQQMKMDLSTFSQNQGYEAGSLFQNLLSVTREKYDYSSFLRKFAVMGERMQTNDEEFDYIYYTYGLSLYKNMPLIEPLEYKDVLVVKEFVIAIDTSGSTSGMLVQHFLQKTYNILKQEESFAKRFNIFIIQCDAAIQEVARITCQDDFDNYIKGMCLYGMGGTDFRPVFDYVDKLVRNNTFTNLKGLIYFTDGYGTFPRRAPDYQTAFVFIDDYNSSPDVPSWAIKLVLQTNELGG